MARSGRRGLCRLGMLRFDRRTSIVAPPYPARMDRALLDRHDRPLGGKGHQAELARRKKISAPILGILDANCAAPSEHDLTNIRHFESSVSGRSPSAVLPPSAALPNFQLFSGGSDGARTRDL